MSFTLVLSSNAHPSAMPNTAASFQTDFENAIDLLRKWEVALQDVNHVNMMDSLISESLNGSCRRRYSDDQAFKSPHESPHGD